MYNIFLNIIDPDIISGNSTATISDHLPQSAIIPNMFGNTLTPLRSTLLLQLKLPKTTKYPHKHLLDYLKEEWDSTIFLKPTSKEEIDDISSLNSNKASSPNSVP